MKKIFLLRHAESPSNNLDDFNRVLSQKGINKCIEVAKIIKNFNLDIIFSSSALRTKQTIENILQYSNHSTKVEYLDKLYTISATEFLDFITEQSLLYDQILFVGHNPVISQLPFLIDNNLQESKFFTEIQAGFSPASLAEFIDKKLTSFWR